MKKLIDDMLDKKVNEMKYDINGKLQNLHIDLIRQFCQQETSMEDNLRNIALSNKKQKEVIA